MSELSPHATEDSHHLNQEPADFEAAKALLRLARRDLETCRAVTELCCKKQPKPSGQPDYYLDTTDWYVYRSLEEARGRGCIESELTPLFKSLTPSATARMSELVPTTWLDPLLTGPKAVVKSIPGNGNFTGTDIERLLKAIKERIQAAEPFQ